MAISVTIALLALIWQVLQNRVLLRRQPISVLGHDHRFSPTAFDGVNDLEAMVLAGLNTKVVPLITDQIDWQDGQQIGSADVLNSFDVQTWSELFEQRAQALVAASGEAGSNVMLIKEPGDFRIAKDEGKAGLILASEGVSHLEGSLDQLTAFYELGLRHVQLFRPALNVEHPAVTVAGGLTSFGQQLIEQCNELGIAVDVAHLDQVENKLTVLNEVIARSEDPVVLSHQNPTAFGGRVSDAELLAVRGSGGDRGVIGVHFHPQYVTPEANIGRVADIIDYLVALVGIDHVALGGDYFPREGIQWAVPDLTSLHDLRAELAQRGYDNGDVNQIMGGNLVAYYEAVWKQ